MTSTPHVPFASSITCARSSCSEGVGSAPKEAMTAVRGVQSSIDTLTLVLCQASVSTCWRGKARQGEEQYTPRERLRVYSSIVYRQYNTNTDGVLCLSGSATQPPKRSEFSARIAVPLCLTVVYGEHGEM